MNEAQMTESKMKFTQKDLSGASYSMDPKKFMGGYWARQCLRCKDTRFLDDCKNCGGKEFESNRSGIYCSSCKLGFDRWTCPACGTDNPLSTTFGMIEPKGACFVATATFGDYESPEVVYLSSFRDKCLKQFSIGLVFIRLYYRIGPLLANSIEKSNFLRVVSRKYFLMPIIKVLRIFFNPKN